MKKILFLLILLSLISISYSQTQLGEDILGDTAVDNFGEAFAMSNDGTHVVIGSKYKNGNGLSRVYKYVNEDWVQIGQDIYGEAQSDLSGASVSISENGNRIAIGAKHNDGTADNSGHVRIYQLIGVNWVQLGNDIDGESEGDEFGVEVTLSTSGNRIAIGADLNDSSAFNGGQVKIYEYINEMWIQLGQDINGTRPNGRIGSSLSLSSNGNKIAINSPLNAGTGSNGYVQVYEYNGSNWNQVGSNIFDYNDVFGKTVSLSSDGNTIGIGTIFGGAPYVSYVRIYQFNAADNNWIQKGSRLHEEYYDGWFGVSVSISEDGTIIAIGDSKNDGNGTLSGNAQVFRFDNNVNDWIQMGVDIDGSNAYDNCGVKVSLSNTGNRVAVGAPSFDGNGVNSGHVRVYDLTEFLLNVNDNEVENLSIYPNPVSEILIVKSSNPIIRMDVYNILGEIVKTIFNDNKINFSNLNDNIYIVKVKMINKSVVIRKIVKI